MTKQISMFFLLFAALFIFGSCKTNINKVMEGTWVVDTIYYKGYDVKPCVLANMIIFFEKNNRASLCKIDNRCDEALIGKNIKTDEGSWEIIQSINKKDTMPLSIKFNTKNEIFTGVHKLVFHKEDKKKLLKIEIFSDDLYMICVKTLFYYDSNKELIDELEKLSWSNRPSLINKH
ncbi:MAG: hypothetical protein V4538_17665 [Bacteroidota bacterium]